MSIDFYDVSWGRCVQIGAITAELWGTFNALRGSFFMAEEKVEMQISFLGKFARQNLVFFRDLKFYFRLIYSQSMFAVRQNFLTN